MEDLVEIKDMEEAGGNVKLEEMMQEQAAHQKKVEKLVRVCAVCAAGIFAVVAVSAAILVPKGLGLIKRAEHITAQMDEMMPQVQEVVERVQEGDPKALMEDIQSLTQTGEQALHDSVGKLKKAVEVLEKIDIESLNTAVENLGKAVSPLARLFGGR